MRIVEAFSGIGSQAKALERLKEDMKINYDILNIIEWDLNAIYAYDLIHNGVPDLEPYANLTKGELVDRLMQHTLSNDTKSPIKERSLKSMNIEFLRRVYAAIRRTNNLISVTDVRGYDLPREFDLLTYSFPCQDLSTGGALHGKMTGINRNVNNRSGMLWQIERILMERVEEGRMLPRFLLMENVKNILGKAHEENFEEWKEYLRSIGYYNQVYTLNANNFGIPQNRNRTFMISVYVDNDEVLKNNIDEYFRENNLQRISEEESPEPRELINYMKIDYNIEMYLNEARESNPNDTPSRTIIYENNRILNPNNEWVKQTKTITTRQDRNPNAGIIIFNEREDGKALYRNLTPRECFLLMGFDNRDFQVLMDNDILTRGKNKVFTRGNLLRFAGNSIVVEVLEAIFRQIYYINDNILL